MEEIKKQKDYSKLFNICFAILLFYYAIVFYDQASVLCPVKFPRDISSFSSLFDATLAIMFLLNYRYFSILRLKAFAFAGFLIYFNYSVPIKDFAEFVTLSILIGLLTFRHSNKTTIFIFILSLMVIIFSSI